MFSNNFPSAVKNSFHSHIRYEYVKRLMFIVVFFVYVFRKNMKIFNNYSKFFLFLFSRKQKIFHIFYFYFPSTLHKQTNKQTYTVFFHCFSTPFIQYSEYFAVLERERDRQIQIILSCCLFVFLKSLQILFGLGEYRYIW